MKTLGVIGGLGPLATAYCMELVIRMTDASCDQEHLDMVIYNHPGVPDRTRYILGLSGESPLGPMIDTGRKLKEQGAQCIAIPCVTAHYFHRELEEGIKLPIIHMIRETAGYLKERGILSAGVMATDGTVKSRLFQEEFENCGIRTVFPSLDGQRKVMRLIYDNVKAGEEIDEDAFFQVEEELRAKGAEVSLLGCTELSIVKKSLNVGPGVLDVMEVLARSAVQMCGAPLKQEYEELITR